MKKEEIELLIKTLQSLQDPEDPPPPPPPEQPQEPEKHPYITINGKEPKAPQDFLSSGKGKAAVAAIIALAVTAFFAVTFLL